MFRNLPIDIRPDILDTWSASVMGSVEVSFGYLSLFRDTTFRVYHLSGKYFLPQVWKYERWSRFAYTGDGYIKDKLTVTIQVSVTELKRVLKEDTGLDLHVGKTSVLPKGVSQESSFDMTQNIIQGNPCWLTSGDVDLGSFCPESFVGIGVTIGTDVCTELCC